MFYRMLLLAPLALAVCAFQGCSKDWPAFRHNGLRTANQPNQSRLSDPARVPTLQVKWTFQPSSPQGFYTSPIVSKGRVYIGNGNGYFYALDADNGSVAWQYPASGAQPLDSQFHCNPSSFGIASTAMIAKISGTRAVIFGAPDQSSGSHLGDGHLFALNADTGVLIWESPPVAQVTGTNFYSTSELHEQIGYSSPLIFNGHVYVGIANHCDNPIQNGKVVAVRLSDGSIDGGFSYTSTSTRGGGVWSSVTGWDDLYVTTGNVRSWNPTNPAINHGLAVLRLNRNTGAIVWQHQPVPYDMDDDPDWSSGATVMLSSCGTQIVSTQKDGWTWALNNANGAVNWGFPTGPWVPGGFTPGDGTVHNDTRYMRPGAAWGDVFITTTGGLEVTTNVGIGYGQIHALNVCAPEKNRVRWLKNVPSASGGAYSLGPPTVSRGMVYVGTDQGHLVAIADPSIHPAAGWRCNDPLISNLTCSIIQALSPNSIVRLVPDPAVLADVTLPGAGSIFGEPSLTRNRVFIAGSGGKLFMLEVDP
jgi:outer membrane protein assembly factor BamB